MIRNISHIKYFSLIINNLLDNRNILLERELIACIERGNLLKIIFLYKRNLPVFLKLSYPFQSHSRLWKRVSVFIIRSFAKTSQTTIKSIIKL